jgi:ATP-dependent Lhr-like helicase
MAVAEPFDALALYDEVTSAEPYRYLDYETFERVVDFVATGGYALRSYDRYAKIRRRSEGKHKGLWGITHPRVAQQYRLNVGTIVELPMLNVRLGRPRAGVVRGGKLLGKVEEYFLEQLTQGDTFRFAGRVLRFEGIRENEAFASPADAEDPMIPSYEGGKFPLTTYLAGEVRAILADPPRWRSLPDQVREWLLYQQERSRVPGAAELLVETFPHNRRYYMAAYPFEGRLAHQTLGMLLTRRLERAGARPLGFVATDYSLAVWALRDLGELFDAGRPSLAALFDEDMLGDDLEAWLAESYLLKRTFRNCAIISGLIERRHPGQEKTGRQMTISTDLVYDVLRAHEPDHILLRATRNDAAAGLLDIQRLGEMLLRVKARIMHQRLDRVSPLAVPVMMQIGRESVPGEGRSEILAEAAEALIREAMGEGHGRGEGAKGNEQRRAAGGRHG